MFGLKRRPLPKEVKEVEQTDEEEEVAEEEVEEEEDFESYDDKCVRLGNELLEGLMMSSKVTAAITFLRDNIEGQENAEDFLRFCILLNTNSSLR